MKTRQTLLAWSVISCCFLFSCAWQKPLTPSGDVEAAAAEQSLEDPLLTQMITLKETQAVAMKNVLFSMLSPEGEVVVVPVPDLNSSKTLIITDRASVLHVALSSIQDEIASISATPSQSAAGFIEQDASPSQRAETTIPRGKLELLETVVEETGIADIGEDAETAGIYIYRAQYCTIQELLITLETLYGSAENASASAALAAATALTPSIVAAANAASAAAAATAAASPIDEAESAAIAAESAAAAAESAAAAAESAATATEAVAELEYETGLPRFVAVNDPMTNACLIVATAEQIQEIKHVLKSIDVRPLQVFLDVAIAEISLLEGEFVGIQGSALNQGQVAVGGETDSIISLTETTFTAITPPSAQGFNFIASVPGRIAARLRMLAEQDRIKVLSDPHIFVVNNSTAQINIGEDIPIPSYAVSQGIVEVDIEHQSTGITLKVTPHINHTGDILLDVNQSVKDVGSENYGNTGAASFNTRETTTRLIIQDNTSMLIGGLISRERKLNEQGVPILKDIPLLGRLFRSRDQSQRRRELIILLTAQVMWSADSEVSTTNDAIENATWWLSPDNEEKTDTEKIKAIIRDLKNE